MADIIAVVFSILLVGTIWCALGVIWCLWKDSATEKK